MSDTSKTSSAPRHVTRAIVTKASDVFFLSEQDGEVPAGGHDGFGLYYHDCRYLDGYAIRFAGTTPNVLASTASRGGIAQFELTNKLLHIQERKTIPAQTFGMLLERAIDGDQLTVRDTITIENYDVRSHDLPLSLEFQSHFEDVFEIRGLHPKKIGRANKPEWAWRRR